MAMTDSREAIFTVEFPDGQVYTGSAMTVEISEDRPVGEEYRLDDDISALRGCPRTWEIELRGIGPLTVEESGKFIEYLEKGLAEQREWECPYCGRVWPLSEFKCGDGQSGSVGCGASKPAMWWI